MINRSFLKKIALPVLFTIISFIGCEKKNLPPSCIIELGKNAYDWGELIHVNIIA